MLYCNLLLQHFDACVTFNIGHALVSGKLYGVEYSQCKCAVLITVSVSIIIICPLYTAAIFFPPLHTMLSTNGYCFICMVLVWRQIIYRVLVHWNLNFNWVCLIENSIPSPSPPPPLPLPLPLPLPYLPSLTPTSPPPPLPPLPHPYLPSYLRSPTPTSSTPTSPPPPPPHLPLMQCSYPKERRLQSHDLQEG